MRKWCKHQPAHLFVSGAKDAGLASIRNGDRRQVRKQRDNVIARKAHGCQCCYHRMLYLIVLRWTAL